MRRWTKEETDFLINNYKTMNYEDIGEIIDRSPSMIRAKCNDLRLVKKDRWTKEDLALLKEYYPIMPLPDVAEIFGRDETAIYLKASRLGVPKYSYCCNYNFFENIDTEEKAYWLGFIYADGYVNINRKTNSGVVGIELQSGDRNHLDKFNKSIEGNYKISDRERTCNISKNKDKLNPVSGIRIYSIKMFNDLTKLGVNEKKSYNIKFPNFLEEPLMRHFIRGFFDGDGCVTAKNINNFEGKISSPHCSFYCHEKNFLDELKICLEKMGIVTYIYPSNTCYSLQAFSVKSVLSLLDYMYDSASIYLDRKYLRYQRIRKDTES